MGTDIGDPMDVDPHAHDTVITHINDLESAVDSGFGSDVTMDSGFGSDVTMEGQGFEYPSYTERERGVQASLKPDLQSLKPESHCSTQHDTRGSTESNLQATQTLCLLALAAFYTTLAMGAPGDLSNNANAVLRGMESLAVDGATALFVLAGYLDSHAYHDDRADSMHVLYAVNVRPYPHMVLVNAICTPVGMAAYGLWGSALTWVINLGSALYISPFLEYTQDANFRLFNQPTSIVMTFLLCRSLHNLVAASVHKAVQTFPQWHEGVNMFNVIMQTSVSCILTTSHLRDNNFYYSFRFLLPRLSEYTFGCVCHTYLAERKDGVAFRRVAAWLSRYWRWIALLHTLLWIAHLGVTYPANPTPYPLCARAAQGAPCMTHFDAVVSRAVPASLIMVHLLSSVKDSTGTASVIAGMFPTALLAMVYQYPVAALFRLIMRTAGWQRVATVFVASSTVAGWHVTRMLDSTLTHRLVPVVDRALQTLQGYITRE
eukprot:765608-Hanusia_phi.AAC.4